MSKLLSEPLHPLDEAREFFPGRRKPALVSLKRHCTRGYRGIVLESVLLQNKRHTSHEAIARFIAAISVPSCGSTAPEHTEASSNA